MLDKLKKRLKYAKENAHSYIPLPINEAEEIIKEVTNLDSKSTMPKLPEKDNDVSR